MSRRPTLSSSLPVGGHQCNGDCGVHLGVGPGAGRQVLDDDEEWLYIRIERAVAVVADRHEPTVRGELNDVVGDRTRRAQIAVAHHRENGKVEGGQGCREIERFAGVGRVLLTELPEGVRGLKDVAVVGPLPVAEFAEGDLRDQVESIQYGIVSAISGRPLVVTIRQVCDARSRSARSGKRRRTSGPPNSYTIRTASPSASSSTSPVATSSLTRAARSQVTASPRGAHLRLRGQPRDHRRRRRASSPRAAGRSRAGHGARVRRLGARP